jgi:HEAT repeats
MHVQREFSENASFAANVAPAADPGLQPTPDYARLDPASAAPSARTTATLDAKNRIRVARLLALAVGMSGALFVGSLRKMSPPLARADRVHVPPHAYASDAGKLDHLQPQMQAEKLLQLAVGDSGDAVNQIFSRVGRWRGKLVWNSQMASLTTAALNSNDIRVRESGVEVELAAYGLSKNSASLEYLLKTVTSRDHAQKIWALWALGLMANRGVAPQRALAALTAQLHDSEVDSRRWSVDALSLIGADSTIPVLLGVMHDDASPIVRQEAACAIAQSGMFTPEQRMSAVPQLLNYSDDPALDAQTHAWTFQVLGDISGQHLPDDPAAWRNWYQNRN